MLILRIFDCGFSVSFLGKKMLHKAAQVRRKMRSAPYSKVKDTTRLSGKCLNFLLVTFTFQSHICNSLFPFTKLPLNYADFPTLQGCKNVGCSIAAAFLSPSFLSEKALEEEHSWCLHHSQSLWQENYLWLLRVSQYQIQCFVCHILKIWLGGSNLNFSYFCIFLCSKTGISPLLFVDLKINGWGKNWNLKVRHTAPIL